VSGTTPPWLADGLPHLWRPYTQMKGVAPPLAVAATEGCRIKLADGRALIDGISSWWTACHGYNHPKIVAAVAEQARIMPHVMFGGLVHEGAARLAAQLSALTGLAHVFFSDSGSVAVEIALKMAAQFWINRGVRGRTRFVCFRGAYHGDTLGAMSVSDAEAGMHAALADYLPRQHLFDLPRDEAELRAFAEALALVRSDTAAVILEPLVQAAGGMRMHEPRIVAGIAAACRELDVLFIADEIATGFGRTGTMFACERAGVVPDILCLGKALTGGALGMAATLAGGCVFAAFLADRADAALMHGPTYMANPLACAAANASLDLFETEPRLAQVAAIEAHLGDALAPCRDLPGVVDVRVKGAVGAVQVARMRDLQWLKDRFVAEGVWLRPFGDVVYLMPPFVIESGELAALTGAVVRVMEEWSHGR
jgi:adenosylmethionine---8-amino-7-oxononanoate aminotransferase